MTGPMGASPPLARIAASIADASRSRMLGHLLGGEYASAGELAKAATVTPATASAHLARLVDDGLVTCEQRGRHRYFRIADADVAHALEALAVVAERGSHERAWSSPARLRLRDARCCYGHLAGRLGVALLQGMVDRGWLEAFTHGRFAVSDAGVAALDAIGVDGRAWQRRSVAAGKPVAYACLDWSERRDHLAGPLASALLDRCLDAGWLRRASAGDRALQLTPTGRLALAGWLAPASLAA